MEKYKLIETYPNSPKLGTIVLKGASHDPHPDLYANEENTMFFKTDEIEKFPKNWQKITEKDYEILKIKAKLNHPNIPVNKIIDSWVNVNLDYFDIHSVKRLSDREIFTVGDIDNFGKITGFIIRENKIVSQYYRVGDWQWLSSIQRIKKPLFTTEDGVEIFEGDEIIFVHKQDLRISGKMLPTHLLEKNRIWDGSDGYLQFSTEKAAEKYILENKPCLSIKDVQDIYVSAQEKSKESKSRDYYAELVNKVKSKIKC